MFRSSTFKSWIFNLPPWKISLAAEVLVLVSLPEQWASLFLVIWWIMFWPLAVLLSKDIPKYFQTCGKCFWSVENEQNVIGYFGIVVFAVDCTVSWGQVWFESWWLAFHLDMTHSRWLGVNCQKSLSSQNSCVKQSHKMHRTLLKNKIQMQFVDPKS